MREIEFKAKSSENGEWVYGDLAHSYSVKNGVKVDCFLVGLNYDFYEVISETVCQFTGLKDKNGEKIFEGDKFQYQEHEGYYLNNFNGFVKYEDGCFGFQIIDLDNYLSFYPFSDFDELPEDFLMHMEVIGNIHDKIK